MSKQNTKKSYTRHRNRSQARQRRALYLKSLRNIVLVMAILGGFAGGFSGLAHHSTLVLAYATNVNHSGLLGSTNQQRLAGGLGALGMDSRLNAAAQAKANDMVAKNYWSHTSPDGRQPWDFIIAAGYSYNRAGENLAYGALTSEETVQAWMNSPGHRANIMNAGFTQVGFGFANSANFQERGPQTVVVAMYATPYSVPAPKPKPPTPAPAPAPAPVAPAPVAPAPQPPTKPAASPSPSQPTNKPQPAVSQSTTPTKPQPKDGDKVSDQKTPSSERDEKPEEDEDLIAAAQVDQDGNETIAPAEEAQTVRRVAVVTGNYTPWAVVLALLVGIVALGIFMYRHSKAWHSRIVRGGEFIVKHPVIDAVAVMTIVVAVVLLQSIGQVL